MFVGDAQLGAGLAPEVRSIAATVVGQDLLDDDAACSEPGNSVTQDLDRSVLGFVLPGLEVGST